MIRTRSGLFHWRALRVKLAAAQSGEKLDDEIEETKTYIAATGSGARFAGRVGSRFRSQNAKFASAHSQHSSAANANSNSAHNAAGHPTRHNDDNSLGHAIPHAATDTKPNAD